MKGGEFFGLSSHWLIAFFAKNFLGRRLAKVAVSSNEDRYHPLREQWISG
jgi:hypothetical protein